MNKADTINNILVDLQGIANEVDLTEDGGAVNGVPAQERLEQQLRRIEASLYELACNDSELGPVGQKWNSGGWIDFIWPDGAPFGRFRKVLEEKYGGLWKGHLRSPLVEAVSAHVCGKTEEGCGEWQVTGWRVADLRNPEDESEILVTLTKHNTGAEDVLTLTCEDGVIYWEDFSHKTPIATVIGPLDKGVSVYEQLLTFFRDIPAVYANRVRKGVAQ